MLLCLYRQSDLLSIFISAPRYIISCDEGLVQKHAVLGWPTTGMSREILNKIPFWRLEKDEMGFLRHPASTVLGMTHHSGPPIHVIET